MRKHHFLSIAAVLIVALLTLPNVASSQAAKPAGCKNRQVVEDSSELVAVMYCHLLRRYPEPQAIEYWSSELDAGLSSAMFVAALQSSPEYQNRFGSTSSYQDLLGAVRRDPTRVMLETIKITSTKDTPVVEKPVAPQPQAAPVKPLPPVAPQPPVDDGFRKRTTISNDTFRTWIDTHAINIGASYTFVTPGVAHLKLETSNQSINILYTHLSQSRGMSVSPGNRGAEPVGGWAREIGAVAGINANWYSPYDGPAVSGGSVYGGDDHAYTALFGFDSSNNLIAQHHSQVNGAVDSRVREAVAGHPTLIFQGDKLRDSGDPTVTKRHPRTALGVGHGGDVLIAVTVDGRRVGADGMTGFELADLMSTLGAYDAVMLDGGGSSTMWVAGKGIVNQPSVDSPRAVKNQIAFYGN